MILIDLGSHSVAAMTKRRRRATPTGAGGNPSNAGNTSNTGKFMILQPSSCAVCDEAVSTSSVLKCKTCDCSYHPPCVDIDDDTFEVLHPILPVVGWVCPNCVSHISEKRKSVDKDIQSLTDAVRKLEENHRVLSQKVESSMQAVTSVTSPATSTNITKVVSDTVKDQLRRKKNIIVSGLPESADVSDAEALQTVCEEHLLCKPWFDANKMRRIGKSTPRRLLVSLSSEQAATELLHAARSNLRRVDPNSTASRIYFNPDLSPDESRKAYLQRQERRMKNLASTNATANSTLNPSAAPFPASTG